MTDAEQVPTFDEWAILEYRGHVGRLNGITAEPGTILGPDIAGQWFTALANDDQGVTVGYATTHDIDAALAREPRSVAELALHRSRPYQQQY